MMSQEIVKGRELLQTMKQNVNESNEPLLNTLEKIDS